MSEARTRSAFIRIAKQQLGREFTLIRHEDVRTGGIPDLSVAGLGVNSWWEFKGPDGGKKDRKPLQEIAMIDLDRCGGPARYVLWLPTVTAIMAPVEYKKWADSKFQGPAQFLSSNSTHDHHWWLTDFIRGEHRRYMARLQDDA